jgi:hypothetical protein
MNKQVWMAAVAAGALAVSGCGGEDSAPPPVSSAPSPTQTPTPSPSPTLPTTPLYSVSTVTPVPYPNGYTVPTTNPSDFNTDPCRLDLDVVTYPQSWLRGRTLPQATGAPLNPAIGRGVLIKDIMLDDNPAFVLKDAPDAPNGCENGTGALSIELDKTAKRIAGLGAGYVKIAQWTSITENPNGSYSIINPEDNFGPISDQNLKVFVESAHNAGLKVVLWNQIQIFVDAQRNFTPTPENSVQNYEKWFTAFGSFMQERASFYESIGLDVWDTGCHFCVFNGSQEKSQSERLLFYNRYLKISTDVKKIYKGMTFIANNDWFDVGSEYLNQTDFIDTGIWSNKSWTLAESDDLTPQLYRTTLSSNIADLLKLGKPLFISVGIQSRRNALSEPGYLEETACTAAINDIELSNSQCVQKETEVDFALQAIVIQAELEYIKSMNSNNVIVFAADYFATDNLYPQTAYPNIGYTIRNKPAEGVVREWFRK